MHDGLVREVVGYVVEINKAPNRTVPEFIQRQFSPRERAESELKGLGNGKGHLFDKSMRTRSSLLSGKSVLGRRSESDTQSKWEFGG